MYNCMYIYIYIYVYILEMDTRIDSHSCIYAHIYAEH